MRQFEHFPKQETCPICHTNDDGPCVLVPIAGTEDGSNIRAQPLHLSCAVVNTWDEGMGVGMAIPYRPIDTLPRKTP